MTLRYAFQPAFFSNQFACMCMGIGQYNIRLSHLGWLNSLSEKKESKFLIQLISRISWESCIGASKARSVATCPWHWAPLCWVWSLSQHTHLWPALAKQGTSRCDYMVSAFISSVLARINTDQYTLSCQPCNQPWMEGKFWLMFSYYILQYMSLTNWKLLI